MGLLDLFTGGDKSYGHARTEENAYNERIKVQNQRLKTELQGTLDTWRSSPFLKELLSPAHESRNVAVAADSARAGAKAAKGQIADYAAAQGLGRQFVARQGFNADLGAAASIAGARQTQALSRATTGAAVDTQYAQSQADITNLWHGLERQRKAEHLNSYQRYKEAQAAHRSAINSGWLQLGTLAAGGIAGAAGATSAGVGLGGLAKGAGYGLMAGGVLSGDYGMASGVSSIMGMANGGQLPSMFGNNPLLAYALGALQSSGMQTQAPPAQTPPGNANWNNVALGARSSLADWWRQG
jgi:hypothetical protein